VTSQAYSAIWKHEIKHNPDLFKTYIIATCDTRKATLIKERRIHDKLNVVKSPMYINMATAKENGFFGRNVSGSLNPNYGKQHSLKAKIKMRKRRHLTDEQRQQKAELLRKINACRYADINVREQQRQKMSGANNPQYGKYGPDHPHYGHHHTDEAKQKIRQALKGKKKTTQHIKRSSTSYKIQREIDSKVFVGYGLVDFSKAIGLRASSFLYTLTSNKYKNGYRILENLGMTKDDHAPLTDILTNPVG